MPTMRPTFLAAAAAALLGASIFAPSIADAGPRQTAPRTQIVAVERTSSGAVPSRTAPARATATDADRYAARDAKAKAQKSYEGGSYVVIGLSGTAIVVIILLLILL